MTSRSPQYVTPVMSHDSLQTGTSEIYNSKMHLKIVFMNCHGIVFVFIKRAIT